MSNTTAAKHDPEKLKTSQDSEPAILDINSRSNNKRFWLVPILLVVALFLPFFGEWLQYENIGDEYVCCMPENYQELYEKAEKAKTLRPVSNIIIGGPRMITCLFRTKS